jgi:hypothetical protein
MSRTDEINYYYRSPCSMHVVTQTPIVTYLETRRITDRILDNVKWRKDKYNVYAIFAVFLCASVFFWYMVYYAADLAQ